MPPSPPLPPPVPPSPPTASSGGGGNAGAFIGGAVGGAALVVIALVLLCYCRSRKSSKGYQRLPTYASPKEGRDKQLSSAPSPASSKAVSPSGPKPPVISPEDEKCPVVWESQDPVDGLWGPYSDADSAMLERHWRSHAVHTPQTQLKTTELSFNVDFGTEYAFDFSAFTQLNMETLNCRYIRRVQGSSVLPRQERQRQASRSHSPGVSGGVQAGDDSADSGEESQGAETPGPEELAPSGLDAQAQAARRERKRQKRHKHRRKDLNAVGADKIQRKYGAAMGGALDEIARMRGLQRK